MNIFVILAKQILNNCTFCKSKTKLIILKAAKFYLVVNALLSGKRNCPEKKLSKKKIWTKNWPDNFFLPALAMPLFFLVFIMPLICCLEYFCPYVRPIVQQKHGTYFFIILTFIHLVWMLHCHNLQKAWASWNHRDGVHPIVQISQILGSLFMSF